MTKMIKMSLIAAVAVTGMTSVATAQPLEEAIKGVDISGMMRYRYDDGSTTVKEAGQPDDKTSTQDNNYRLDVNLKSKVNDIVSANITANVGVGAQNDGKGASLGQNTEAAATVAVRNANFTFALPVATVIAGKQSIPGPFVDNTVDDVTRGTGVVALVPAGPVTIAAGHFMTHNVVVPTNSAGKIDKSLLNALYDDTNAGTIATSTALINNTDAKTNTYLNAKDAYELAVLGSAAGVSFDVWYANVADSLTALSFGAKGAVAGINIDARHSSLDMKDAYNGILGAATYATLTTDSESSLTKIVASTKVSTIDVRAGIATTGKHNGILYNRIAIDNDNDSQSDFRVWQLSAGMLPDATAFLIGATSEVMPSVKLSADYLTASAKESDQAGAKDMDATELLFKAQYAMSKNFAIEARYSMATLEGNGWEDEMTKGRLELKYTF